LQMYSYGVRPPSATGETTKPVSLRSVHGGNAAQLPDLPITTGGVGQSYLVRAT